MLFGQFFGAIYSAIIVPCIWHIGGILLGDIIVLKKALTTIFSLQNGTGAVLPIAFCPDTVCLGGFLNFWFAALGTALRQ